MLKYAICSLRHRIIIKLRRIQGKKMLWPWSTLHSFNIAGRVPQSLPRFRPRWLSHAPPHNGRGHQALLPVCPSVCPVIAPKSRMEIAQSSNLVKVARSTSLSLFLYISVQLAFIFRERKSWNCVYTSFTALATRTFKVKRWQIKVTGRHKAQAQNAPQNALITSLWALPELEMLRRETLCIEILYS